MNMNRKWNMKVFELHDSESGQDSTDDITIMDPVEEVNNDTATASITMQKAPFDYSEIKAGGEALLIDFTTLTADSQFEEDFFNTSKWSFKQGSTSNLTVADGEDKILTFKSIVSALFDMPTEATRWILRFDYAMSSSLYRSFFYFDGKKDTENDVRYEYGMDIPRVLYPHLEEVIEYSSSSSQVIEETIADEQYFTGDYMSVIVTRWDNVYTLCYDDRYLITIPTEADSVNRIGWWAWSSSFTKIKNPKLYIIDSEESADNVIIENLTGE